MRISFHYGWTVIATLASIGLVSCRIGEPEATPRSPTPRSVASVSEDDLPTPWGSFDDALLELRLRLALLEQIGVPALGVEPQVSNGTARLRGRVPSDLARTLVEEVAADTPGVEDLDSYLEVTADATVAVGPLEQAEQRLADALLAARARAALVRELGRSAFDLLIETADDQLILRGTVTGHDALERALSAVADLEGVEQIHDLLEIAG